MIRPLRRRHRRMIAAAALLLALGGWIALRYPVASRLTDRLPDVLEKQR
jgi:hypothetical protein